MSLFVTSPACGCRADVETPPGATGGMRFAASLVEIKPTLGLASLGYQRLLTPPRQVSRVPRATSIVGRQPALGMIVEMSCHERASKRRAVSTVLWPQGADQSSAQREHLTLPIENRKNLNAVDLGLAEQRATRAEAPDELVRCIGEHRRIYSDGRTEREYARDRSIARVWDTHCDGESDHAMQGRRLAPIVMKRREGA